MARTGHAEVVRLFAETMVMMSMAQLAEDRAAFDYDQTVDDYLRRIRGKTASLFAIAAQGGALLSGASHEDALALRVYGENLGMAFQIVDDILDFSGDEREMGKPVGSDLMQGTLTLPSLLLIERCPGDNPVRRLFQDNDGSEHLKEAIAMVCGSDILGEAYATANGFGDAARCGAFVAAADAGARVSGRDRGLRAGAPDVAASGLVGPLRGSARTPESSIFFSSLRRRWALSRSTSRSPLLLRAGGRRGLSSGCSPTRAGPVMGRFTSLPRCQ